ncbi:MAG: hypothetical protein Q8907_13610 [Bacteroidota bacterium]|nr:hypothetical protein [Bacteroidota bacterium]MDP4275309.1 hypothetical protein [Bacteroidota bacterium]
MAIIFDFEKFNSSDTKVKYGFAKELLKIASCTPELLYEYFDQWTILMKNKNNILKWTAIDIIGYLSRVDKEDKTVEKINDLFKLLHAGKLITCNHAIFALELIAQNKHQYLPQIIDELLAVSRDKFDTEECKNIATGKVLDALKPFLGEINNNQKVVEFIQIASNNSRNSTKRKAEQLIRKLEKYKLLK